MNTSGVGGPERAPLLSLHKFVPSPPKTSLPGKVLAKIWDVLKSLGKTIGAFASQQIRGRPWFEYEGTTEFAPWLRETLDLGKSVPRENSPAFKQLEKRLRALSKRDSELAEAYQKALPIHLKRLQEDPNTSDKVADSLRQCSDLLEVYENRLDNKALTEILTQTHKASVLKVPGKQENEVELGKQEVVLSPSVRWLVVGKQAELAFYTKKKDKYKSQGTSQDKIAYCDKMIGRLGLEIEKLEKEIQHEKSWVTSDDYRFYGRNNDTELDNRSARDRYIPALVNARKHTISTSEGGESITIVRSGAVTYPTDKPRGAVDQDFEDRTPRGRALEDQMLQLIQNQVEIHKDSLAAQGFFTLFQVSVCAPNKKDQPVKDQLSRSEGSLARDMQMTFKHFQDKTLRFDGKGPFIEVVDPKDRTKDIIHLPVELQNAEGKPLERKLNTVLFNVAVQGETQNTGIQREINQQGIEKLRTLITKTHPNNPAFDDEINSLSAMLEKKGSWYEFLQATFKTKHSLAVNPYDINVRLMLLAKKLNYAVGVNCFSGKDRTGYQVVKLADKLMELDALRKVNNGEYLKEGYQIPHPIDVYRLLNQARRKYLSRGESVAVGVVTQNTGHQVLKVTEGVLLGVSLPWRLKLYVKAWRAGF